MLGRILHLLKGEKEPDSCKYDVIVDFVFINGLFFISIKNTSDKPVFKVSIKFDKKLIGIEGSKEISALPLFNNIEFLAPQKEIRTFLDTSASYFRRGGPTEITARIAYQDSTGKKYTTTIRHNLEIYREIGYIET
jgi:hypothetical protein